MTTPNAILTVGELCEAILVAVRAGGADARALFHVCVEDGNVEDAHAVSQLRRVHRERPHNRELTRAALLWCLASKTQRTEVSKQADDVLWPDDGEDVTIRVTGVFQDGVPVARRVDLYESRHLAPWIRYGEDEPTSD